MDDTSNESGEVGRPVDGLESLNLCHWLEKFFILFTLLLATTLPHSTVTVPGVFEGRDSRYLRLITADWYWEIDR